MTDASHTRLSRRRLLMGGAGLTAGALGAASFVNILRSPGTARADGSPPHIPSTVTVRRALAGTDGWAYLPVPANVPADVAEFFPDDLAPAPLNAYVYGFVDVTAAHLAMTAATNDTDRALAHDQIYKWKGHTQNQSPMMAFDEGDQVEITLYNLGWQTRPDIPDGHTIHWHGFKNATPWFDGVPEMSGAAPINKSFTYFYDCQEPGTYMYHCHWEDVEHIQMGMTGVVFIRPRLDKGASVGNASVSGARTSATLTVAAPSSVQVGDQFRFVADNTATAYRMITAISANRLTLTLSSAYPTGTNSGPAQVKAMKRDIITGGNTLYAGGPVITGVGTTFDTQVAAGDSVKFTANGDNSYVAVTGAVTATQINLGGAYTGSATSGPLTVRKANAALGTAGTPGVQNNGNGNGNTRRRINGSGTSFLTDVQVGDFVRFGGTGTSDNDFRQVAAVVSNTQLTLTAAYPGNGAFNSSPLLIRRIRSVTGNGSYATTRLRIDGTNLQSKVAVGDYVRFTSDTGDSFFTRVARFGAPSELVLAAAYPGTGPRSGNLEVSRQSVPAARYVYNNPATAFDREFPMMLMDYDLRQHQKLSHIQQPDWSEYFPNAWTINGRSYPDTLGKNGVQGVALDSTTLPAGNEALTYQPQSALITANEGDRVLLRITSLGYQAHAMTLDGIPYKVIGRDANDLGTAVYSTDTIDVAPGEAYDVLFTAPAYAGNGTDPDVYLFYDRNYENDNSGGDSTFAGMATEVHVYPAGHLRAQTAPNDQGLEV